MATTTSANSNNSKPQHEQQHHLLLHHQVAAHNNCYQQEQTTCFLQFHHDNTAAAVGHPVPSTNAAMMNNNNNNSTASTANDNFDSIDDDDDEHAEMYLRFGRSSVVTTTTTNSSSIVVNSANTVDIQHFPTSVFNLSAMPSAAPASSSFVHHHHHVDGEEQQHGIYHEHDELLLRQNHLHHHLSAATASLLPSATSGASVADFSVPVMFGATNNNNIWPSDIRQHSQNDNVILYNHHHHHDLPVSHTVNEQQRLSSGSDSSTTQNDDDFLLEQSTQQNHHHILLDHHHHHADFFHQQQPDDDDDILIAPPAALEDDDETAFITTSDTRSEDPQPQEVSPARMYETLPVITNAGPLTKAAASNSTVKQQSSAAESVDRRTRRGKRKLACRTTAITTYPPPPPVSVPQSSTTTTTTTTTTSVSNIAAVNQRPLTAAQLQQIQQKIDNKNKPVSVPVVKVDSDAIAVNEDEEVRDSRTVFCSTFGRLNLMNAKERHDVSRAEIKRRLAPPECLNMSLLSGILRRAKTKNGGPAFRARLERSGLSVNAGRRPSTRVTLFTSILEAESVALARDFVQVVDREFPLRPLAEYIHSTAVNLADKKRLLTPTPSSSLGLNQSRQQITNDEHGEAKSGCLYPTTLKWTDNSNTGDDLKSASKVFWHDRYNKLSGAVQVLNELRVILENDRSAVMNRRPTPVLPTYAHTALSRFSNLTHGFGTTAIVGTLKPLEECIVLMATMAQAAKTAAEKAENASVVASNNNRVAR